MKIDFSTSLLMFFHLSIFLSCDCFPKVTEEDEAHKNAENSVKKYKPVIIIHGLISSHSSLMNITKFIEKEHPGTEVYAFNILYGIDSLFTRMWFQVKQFYELMVPIMKKAKNGVNLIGYSQGGLVARGIIESRDHNVHNFISLASPQAGHYGDVFLNLVNLSKSTAYEWFYSNHYQIYSVPNYWNDPHHQSLYMEYCEYLPVINNDHKGLENDTYKKNLLKLNKLVLIGGPDDGIISPWQSSHFSFYDEAEKVIDFRQRRIYKDDLIGLKTLDKMKKLRVYEVKNVKHLQWHENEEVMKSVILPWLD